MKIKKFKPVNVYTHPSITEYEFLRMNGSKAAIKGACFLLSVPFIVSMCFGAYSMAIRPNKWHPIAVSYVKKYDKEVAPLLSDEMDYQEVHATPVIEIRKGDL